MFTTLSRWAEPPSFPGDEEKTQNASLCNQAILLSLLFSVVMIATGLLGQNVASRTLAIGGLWVVVLLVMWRMSHSVYQPLVAPALAGLFFAFLTAVNISQGSIRTPSASFYVFWVIMVGLLYKKKGIVLATVFSSLAVLGLILAENAGLLPLLNYSVGVTQWAAYTFLFAITSSAVLHTQKIILQSLSRAEIEIEQRKHIEKSLRLSEYRLRLVSDNAKDVIWVMAPDGKITFVSAAVLALRGYTPAEAIAQTLDKILTPASQAISLAYFVQLHADMAAGRPAQNFRGELEYLCKDGSTVWTDVVSCPIVNEQGMVEILGMSRDISEHKKRQIDLENEGQRLTDQLVQLDRQRSLGQMSAALGHELNQPLTAIMSNAQVIQRGMQTGRLEPVQIEEFLNRIVQNTRRASDNIERIRNFIRPSQSVKVAVDLHGLVHDILAMIALEAIQHKVKLKFAQAPGPFWVQGDAIQLSQVILNIFRNAMQALEQVELREIDIQIKQTKEHVELSITDTGPGLLPEHVGKVGTAFFSTKANGLGMGLSISRDIIGMHHGTMNLSNADNAGLRVTITLPAMP